MRRSRVVNHTLTTPLSPERQGYLWRKAEGELLKFSIRKGSPAWPAFARGWKQADTEIAEQLARVDALLRTEQPTDNIIEGEGS